MKFRCKFPGEPLSDESLIHPSDRLLLRARLRVNPLHDGMEHRPERASVQIVDRFCEVTESQHLVIVELRRAGKIVLKRGCGKLEVAQSVKVGLCLDNFRLRVFILPNRRGHIAVNLSIEKVGQLFYIAALFTGLNVLGAGIEEHPDILRALNHAVEIVGPDGVLILVGRKPESFA